MFFLVMGNSKWEIGLLMMVFMFFFIFFVGFVYYVEYKELIIFFSVFMGIWWLVIIMMIVGYGDEYLRMLFGRIVGMVCVLLGVLIIVMFIVIIVFIFSDFNDKNKVRLKC